MKVPVENFRQYSFQVGQKIHIEDGARKGDWEVVSVDEKKVGLRCPVTGTEVNWVKFCYRVNEQLAEWPEKD